MRRETTPKRDGAAPLRAEHPADEASVSREAVLDASF